MTEQIQGDKTDRSKARSSLGISQKIVCEDEACIGKVVDSASSAPGETGSEDKKANKSNSSSMSIGGSDICSEDACIGKD
jgi:hypothetical protein